MKFEQYPDIQEFYSGLDKLGISLSEKQVQQFVDYYELLIDKNKVMNLTAITEFKDVITKHFIDSLSIVKCVTLTNERVLDVGTGAGFPGIPLKILYPDIDLVLLDSLNKRLVFLEEVIENLDLKKVITLHGRAEDYAKKVEHREKYDLCVSRAVAKLSSLAEYCLPYVKKDGFFISYKSGKVEEELYFSRNALNILGGKVEQVKEFTLPGTDIERALVMIRKTSITPKNYPRTAGKPSKEPL